MPLNFIFLWVTFQTKFFSEFIQKILKSTVGALCGQILKVLKIMINFFELDSANL